MQASSHGDQASMANIKRSLRSRLSTINSKVKASKRSKKNTNSVPTIDDPDVSDGSNISDKDVVMVTDNENEEEVDNSIWDGNGQDDDEEMDFLNDTDDVDDEKD
ncbi:uncharacterized protein [Ptychodera flava]|uniref:uncharacterized protein n=1 Tax=Ptychodera flava TaxID=63121 RepID=UPI00396A756A